jgi:hypothetical protein
VAPRPADLTFLLPGARAAPSPLMTGVRLAPVPGRKYAQS